MRVAIIGNHVENVAQAFHAHEACSFAPDDNGYSDLVRGFSPEYPTWDLLIAFPPCKFLCSSGLHWNTRRPERAAHTEEALGFVCALLDLPVARIALENPVGCISSRIRKPDQLIQPHDFGHDASKRTCLWLKNLPHLRGTKMIAPRIVNGRARWGNQFDSGQNNLINAPDRAVARAERYQGIADAMADQWGSL